jgi:hypothetical protein
MPKSASSKQHPLRWLALKTMLAIVTVLVVLSSNMPRSTSPKEALANHCNINCGCVSGQHATTRNWITIRHADTQLFIGNQFIDHRESFLINYFFTEHVLAAMMMMTEQLVSTAMQQTLIIGALLDAKHQSETIRLFQTLMARAHKDYHPDVEMCVIGTHAKSLASAQRKGEATSYILSQMGVERSLNNVNVNAGTGSQADKKGRLELFKDRFCDESDNGDGLGSLCDGSGPSHLQNMDVDYAGLIDRPWTINTDFTTTPSSLRDNAVTAMYQYLYGHDVLEPIAPGPIADITNQTTLLDVRAIAAKRAVAQHSFAALIGQKARGSAEAADTQNYMTILMQEFGIADVNEIDEILGDRPSYYAQMEILTKQIFMREQFYTNLYDKPANVDRKGAAIQALNLVQNMDLFESKLRNEALLAVLVEMELEKAQAAVQNRMNKLDSEDSIQATQ